MHHSMSELISDESLNLGFNTGTLIGVPIPSEFEEEGEVIETAMQTAIQEAE